MDTSFPANFMFEHNTASAFSSLAACHKIISETREMLDSSDKKYFDRYILSLLSSISEILSTDIADQGFCSFKEVREICRRIINNDPIVDTQHQFYPAIKSFVEQHSFQDRQAIIEACCLHIFMEFTQHSLNIFQKNYTEKLMEAMERYGMESKREKAKERFGEDKVREIEASIYNFFKINNPASSYLLGMVESIAMSAQYQDKIAGNNIFVEQNKS